MLNEQNIDRVRGDTAPLYLSVIDDGNGLSGELSGSLPSAGSDAYDVTGCTVVLTVNAKRSPSSTDTPQLQVLGTLLSPANAGHVGLVFTPDQADLVARYWYDVQLTDANGAVHTVARGRWVSDQDITKGNPGGTWKPDPAAVDGTPVVIDGSEFWQGVYPNEGYSVLHATQNSIKVARYTLSPTSGEIPLPLIASGALSSLPVMGPTGVYELTLFFYLVNFSEPTIEMALLSEAGMYAVSALLEVNYDTVTVAAQMPNYDGAPSQESDFGLAAIPSLAGGEGWGYFKFKIDFDNATVHAKAWDAASDEPTSWQVETAGSAVTSLGASTIVVKPTTNSNSWFDLASFNWEKVG